MTVGIVGLGLIGGSMAKAYREAGWHVLASDRDSCIFDMARLMEDVDGALTPETLPRCDLLVLALYPRAVLDWLRENASRISTNTLVIDVCGVKQQICRAAFPLAAKYGFAFIGGHPMAGYHRSGFKYARADLFQNASMVLVPPTRDDIELLGHTKELLKPLGLGKLCVAAADEHDRIIAYTSQLPHLLANTFMKSPTALEKSGFSAGSYRDMTRVARLDPVLWAELTMENRESALRELDCLMENLSQVREALASGDRQLLTRLLREGSNRKEEVDTL